MTRPPLTRTTFEVWRLLAGPALVLTLFLAAGGASRAEAGAGIPGAPGGTLEVASYNVQFVTPDLPLLRHLLREWPGHKPNVTERAEAIARHLACFDVVALQETFNDARRREILERLETAGRGCGKPSHLASGRMFVHAEGPAADRGSWLTLVGNELTLASRWPIVGSGSHVYRHAAEEDVLAAKGVLHARLARGRDVIEVFVTHLQAGDEHGEVRRAQIEELAAFMRGALDGAGGPVLVLGDFNVRGSLVDRRDPASDYNFLRRALDGAVAPRRFADAWLATHFAEPDTDSGTKPRVRDDGSLRAHEERIDHLFVAGGAARAMRRDFFSGDLIVDGAPVGALSDHAALLADVAWPGLPGPARLAASGR
jgi:endonuclease/exonuclease/phosphatase family metal-dependent hydrolase